MEQNKNIVKSRLQNFPRKPESRSDYRRTDFTENRQATTKAA
jgi:hypothetical protein